MPRKSRRRYHIPSFRLGPFFARFYYLTHVRGGRISPAQIALHFDKRYEWLVALLNSDLINGVVAAIFLIGLCSFFLHRYLGPHARLISLISTYEISWQVLQVFGEQLFSLKREGDQDSKNISDAMIHMDNTIERNNQNSDEKNRALGKTVKKLEQSLREVKTLSGLLPICSYCKKIRDDQGYWNQLEEYISNRTDTSFSHGICPDCMEQHHPECADGDS